MLRGDLIAGIAATAYNAGAARFGGRLRDAADRDDRGRPTERARHPEQWFRGYSFLG
jgi:hypothetical protein